MSVKVKINHIKNAVFSKYLCFDLGNYFYSVATFQKKMPFTNIVQHIGNVYDVNLKLYLFNSEVQMGIPIQPGEPPPPPPPPPPRNNWSLIMEFQYKNNISYTTGNKEYIGTKYRN